MPCPVKMLGAMSDIYLTVSSVVERRQARQEIVPGTACRAPTKPSRVPRLASPGRPGGAKAPHSIRLCRPAPCMISIRTFWRSLASSQAHALEAERARLHAEIARLRAENRALLNSILGIAGMKPLPPLPLTSFTDQPAPTGHSESSTPHRAADRSLSTASSSALPAPQAGPATAVAGEPPQRQSETRNGSSASGFSPRSAPPLPHAPPHRRRSWHQIHRLLEFQSARKDPGT